MTRASVAVYVSSHAVPHCLHNAMRGRRCRRGQQRLRQKGHACPPTACWPRQVLQRVTPLLEPPHPSPSSSNTVQQYRTGGVQGADEVTAVFACTIGTLSRELQLPTYLAAVCPT